jgi:hypothetical protein
VWGRARSEVVWIRLGNRTGTYFSAGVEHPGDDRPENEPVPHWPPDGPPPGGWWRPPQRPDGDEIRSVRVSVGSGELDAAEAKHGLNWRLHVYGRDLDPRAVRDLVALTELAEHVRSECLREQSRKRWGSRSGRSRLVASEIGVGFLWPRPE